MFPSVSAAEIITITDGVFGASGFCLNNQIEYPYLHLTSAISVCRGGVYIDVPTSGSPV